ncbi:MAG: archease [Candidatus Pacebacteria bacterium]|nr:archease [Candidatus Paceibacterota bacterium]
MQDKKFEILHHTSDLKIRVFGKTKKDLFLNAMKGMQIALRAEVLNLKSEVREVKIKSNDLNLLLVDFLSEINYLNEINKEVYQNIKFTKFSDTNLEAEIFGKKVKRFGLIIKGVTYYDLNVHQREDKIWEATILFDI